MRNMAAAFARLSPRERLLVSIMVGLVVGGGALLMHFHLQGKVNALETSITDGQAALRKLYSESDAFVVARQRFKANREVARARKDLNLTTAIAGVAGGVSFESTDASGNSLGTKQLKEYLEYAASKVKHLNVGNKPRTGSSRTTPTDGYFQNEQEVKLSDGVPLVALYEFLEKLEKSPDGLFVTELRIERDARDALRAGRNTRIVVSTYYWVPESATPAPGAKP
jgi:hypothetical protein